MKKFKSFIGKFLALAFAAVAVATLAYAVQGVVMASAARTVTTTSSTIQRVAPVGNLTLSIDMTALAASSVTPTIQGVDTDGNVFTVCAGSAISSTGVSTLSVGPSLTVATNKCSAPVPDQWNVLMTQSGVGSNTYGVFYSTAP